jgi:uncharacterized protein YerC
VTRTQERRALAIALALDAGVLTWREIAREFGVSTKTIARIARTLREGATLKVARREACAA